MKKPPKKQINGYRSQASRWEPLIRESLRPRSDGAYRAFNGYRSHGSQIRLATINYCLISIAY